MAVKTWQSGACTVTLDESTGAVRVGGQGAMAFAYSAPWSDVKALFKSLTIEGGVTKIGNYAFMDCSGFTGTLTFPDSITNIGNNAFQNCSGFTGTLTLSNNVTVIESSAFMNCSGFTGTLTFPDSITNIGNNAFMNCSGFTGTLTFPKKIKNIGNNVFDGCSGFTGTLTLPNSITNIGNNAFFECDGFDRVLNHAKTQTVGAGVFYGFKSSAKIYGYPENTALRTAAGSQWRDITEILPHVVTMADKANRALYPRTKGEAVYLDSGKTLEAALGGLSFWRGTQAEYNALSPKPNKTVYCIIGGSVIVT